MKDKINVAELLKDCPQGMELNCTMCEGLEFDGIADNEYLPIRCRIKNPKGGYNVYNFTKYGYLIDTDFSKCVIFPKGKKTWERFHRPFVEGDVVSTESGIYIGIVKSTKDDYECCTFCSVRDKQDFHVGRKLYFSRLATEEEKQKLFDVIKDNGYKWNAETKTLEKLIIPKFKVGNTIQKKDSNNDVMLITDIVDDYYIVETKYGMKTTININIQNNYELVPIKFNINTLVPFESRVLVRDNDYDEWRGAFWSHLRQRADIKYDTIRGVYRQCIPYNDDTKHLLGKTNDCSDFYKNW